MKTLAVSALVCAMMALTRAAALSAAAPEKDQTAKSHLVKRSVYCSGGWSRINGRCFLYNPRPMTWAKAERNCHSLGGNLASVHSATEYHEVQRLIVTASHQYGQAWLGGSEAHEVNNWFWSDGTPFSYNDWCDGEPNHPGIQRCIQMNHSGEKCWDNLGCRMKRPSVCSKRA